MKKRMLSFLLCVVMVAGLLSTVALGDNSHPTYVSLKNQNGNDIDLYDDEYLAGNDATGSSPGYDGTQTYVARYDATSGKLYLKGYEGYTAGDDRVIMFGYSDTAEIVVETDSKLTIARTTSYAYGIEAYVDLTISGEGKLTIVASNTKDGGTYLNNTATGIYVKKGLTVTTSLDISVDSLGDNTFACGIYTYGGAISLSGGDKVIKVSQNASAKTGYGIYNYSYNESSDNGNISVSGKLSIELGKGGTGIHSNYQSSYNKTGTISVANATVVVTGGTGAITNSSNGRNAVDILISKSTFTHTGTLDGFFGRFYSASNKIQIEDSTVTVSSPQPAIYSKSTVTITNSTVNLTNTTTDKYSSSTVIGGNANIDLSTGGKVTLEAAKDTTDPLISGTVTLGNLTQLNKGSVSENKYYGASESGGNPVLEFIHKDPVTVTDLSKANTDVYSVDGHTVTVTYSVPCKVGYLKDSVYVALTAVASTDGNSYSFTVPYGVTNVIIVVKGDVNGDGVVDSSDVTRLKAAYLSKITLTDAELFAGDLENSGKVDSSDVTKLKAAFLDKIKLTW